MKSHLLKALGTTILIAVFFSCLTNGNLTAAPKLTEKLKLNLAKEVKNIEIWVQDYKLIAAVKKQNSSGLSLSTIKQRDLDWRAAKKTKSGYPAFMKATLNSDLSKWFKNKNRANKGRYPEIFLCDNQGANVSLNRYTSDYWQGDEAKWQKSFLGGKGGVFYGDPEYDQSTKSMLVQVSVPVKEGDNTIGVIIVGVKFSKLK